MRAWAPEAGRRGEHERAAHVVIERLKRVSLDRSALVDVAAEDELCAGSCKRSQHGVAVLERELAGGAPGSAGKMVVANHDAEQMRRRLAQDSRHHVEARRVEPTTLVPPRPGRVEPAGDSVRCAQNRVGRADDLDEAVPRPRHPSGERVRNVVIPRDGKDRRRQSVEDSLCFYEFRGAAAIRKIAARDHELRGELMAECDQGVVERRRLAGSAVEVGNVDCARVHGRVRLYTRRMSDQSPEIFDDLFLGLQAGGALRKQRRGEELTEQEVEALGHWQRLSVWRKTVAVGAFAIGTFGLGFTLGGLIFGRRRLMR